LSPIHTDEEMDEREPLTTIGGSNTIVPLPSSNFTLANVPNLELQKYSEEIAHSTHDHPQDPMDTHEETNSTHSTSSIREWVDPLI